MTARARERRLLLVEFVIRDPWVYYGRFFPALQGLAAKLGIPSRWLCFGGTYALEHDEGTPFRQHIELDELSVARLGAVIAELEPTHLVLSDALSDRQLEVVLRERPDVAIVLTSDRPAPGGRARTVFELVDDLPEPSHASLDPDELRWCRHPSWQAGRTDWFLTFLGEPRATNPDYGRYLVDAARPGFRAEMANPEAREYAPHVVLMGGIACDHRLELSDNACFQGLRLDDGIPPFGCSFCTYYRGPTCDPRRNPLQVAEEQLAAVQADCGVGGRNTGAFEVHDVRLFLRLEDFAAMVLRLGLPPSTFVFSPRIDRFLQSNLEEALPRFAQGRHVLSVYRMGGESLVESENSRFNKGVSTDELDRARALWTRLKHEHPETFDYDGTLGYITYTPWTTLEELRDGFLAARARGFREDDVWIYTPLELQSGAGITALAIRDGLACERFEDPAFLYKIALNNIAADSLRPWRFRDPRTYTAFRLIIRYFAAALRGRFPTGVFDGDELYAWLLGLIQAEANPLPSPAAFAVAVIRVVDAAPDDGDLRGLARRALTAADRPQEPSADGDGEATADRAADRRWRAVAEVVRRWLAASLPDVSFELVSTHPDGVRLRARIADAVYALALRRLGDVPGPCLFRTAHLAVSHGADTPLRAPEHLARLRLLAEAFDRVDARPQARAARSQT